MAENLDVFGFDLDEHEMDRLGSLEGQGEPVLDSDRIGH
jgi:hypothetical protein